MEIHARLTAIYWLNSKQGSGKTVEPSIDGDVLVTAQKADINQTLHGGEGHDTAAKQCCRIEIGRRQ